MGVPVRQYGDGTRGRSGAYVYAAGVLAWLWKHRRQYDLVYFLMPGIQIAAGVPLSAALHKPVLMKFSGSNEVNKLTHSFLGRLQLAVLRRWAGRILLLNPGMFEEAAAAGLPSAKLSWMPNPVDMKEFEPASRELQQSRRRELGLDPGALIVVFVGRLAPEKELPSLLDAFAKARRQVPEAQLVLVGEGPERARLAQLARTLDIPPEKIRFVGQVIPQAVRNWLQAADVFALVSRLEGFPVSLLEAMATGLPSVVSSIPANLQLIRDGENGLAASVANADELSFALERLLGDSELRARLRAAARASIQDRYSTEAVVDRYEELFSELG
jgi:glycosyltransferase involved in cell wall biosynthesis